MSQAEPDTGPLAAIPEQTSSLKMVATLGGAGALAGLLIVGVFTLTLGPIEAHKAEVLEQAINEVLNDPIRYETRYASSAGIFESRDEAVKAAQAAERKGKGEDVSSVEQDEIEKIYLGLDAQSQLTGVAVKAGAAGFQDIIELIYGFDPESGQLLGMKVLQSKETPGLGDKIEKDRAFVAQFEVARPPLTAVKRSTGAAGEIDAITGATISPRAVVRIINRSLGELRPAIEAHFRKASR